MSNEEAFKLEPPVAAQRFVAKEPLFSLLISMSDEALDYTLKDISNYESEKALDDILPQTGLSRRETIEQILYAKRVRNGSV